MCLNSVDKDYRKNRNKDFGIGWKIFFPFNGGVECNQTRKVMKFGTWYSANKKESIASLYDTPYQSGFHIFTSRQAAEDYLVCLETKHYMRVDNWEVFRVLYKDVMYIGQNPTGNHGNEESDCVIAGKMLVEKN